jgi:hypothetical protein
LFLGYQLVFEVLRHHDETNLRPMYIDHTIACTLLGGISMASALGGSPKHFITGGVFGALTIAPILYWMKLQGNRPGQMNKPANIFYTNDCTKEQMERFAHQDQTEQLAYQMNSLPGYGYFNKDPRHV